MIKNVSVVVVVDDRPGEAGLIAEHGLSFWIEADGRRILFDTGQGNALEPNARLLGIDIAAADAIVLSHGHYDHTGALSAVLQRNGAASLYLHPAAMEKKFGKHEAENGRCIGMPRESVDAVERRGKEKVCFAKAPTKLADGIWVTGGIPRTNGIEDTGGNFFLDAACTEPDPLADDQSLFIETPRGIVVLLGCAHAGVINTLDYIVSITGAAPLYAVIGGMHLDRASRERLERTVLAFRRHGVGLVAPCHCTGTRATAELRTAFPYTSAEGKTGTILHLIPHGLPGSRP